MCLKFKRMLRLCFYLAPYPSRTVFLDITSLVEPGFQIPPCRWGSPGVLLLEILQDKVMQYQPFASSIFDCLKGVWIFKMFIKITNLNQEDEMF